VAGHTSGDGKQAKEHEKNVHGANDSFILKTVFDGDKIGYEPDKCGFFGTEASPSC
jgi:hypothetical protein